MDKEVLEVILKKLGKESGISKIIGLESVPPLPKGENYSSTIFRVTLKVVLDNGRLAKKSFILKQAITEGESGKYARELKTTQAEGAIYSVIHKHMTYLMEEFEDTDEPLWCNLIHYDPDLSYMLLEDLKASGYSLVPRQKGLDLDHAMLALRGLGRYHGMAKVLEERGIISKEDYKPYGLFTDLKLVKCVPYAGILNLSKVMQKCWGPSWQETAKKLKISFDPFAEKWCSMKTTEESQFTVLNHGDCLSNNMMFKYDFENRPIVVKFLDYQLPHYNTPCVDVTYFFYLGISPPVRRSNYRLLLKTYHESLVRSLDRFGFTGMKPSLEEITATMKRLEFFGLAFFTALYPSLTCKSTATFDPEKLLTSDGDAGFNEAVLTEPGMVEKLGPDIVDFVEKHVPALN